MLHALSSSIRLDFNLVQGKPLLHRNERKRKFVFANYNSNRVILDNFQVRFKITVQVLIKSANSTRVLNTRALEKSPFMYLEFIHFDKSRSTGPLKL